MTQELNPEPKKRDAGAMLLAVGKRLDAFTARLESVLIDTIGANSKAARLQRLLERESVSLPFSEIYAAIDGAEKTRMALFIAAPHHQGGHSRSGAAIADALGVPFPIEMPALLAKAREEEINPALLWPWLVEMRPDFFKDAERKAALAPQGEG